jgi:hypothetical protein
MAMVSEGSRLPELRHSANPPLTDDLRRKEYSFYRSVGWRKEARKLEGMWARWLSVVSRGDDGMTRVSYLKGRAAALRRIAVTIDIRSIRDRVLALAEECIELAKLVEKDMQTERAAQSSRARTRSLRR